MLRTTVTFLHGATRGVNKKTQQPLRHHKGARKLWRPGRDCTTKHPELQQMRLLTDWRTRPVAGLLRRQDSVIQHRDLYATHDALS